MAERKKANYPDSGYIDRSAGESILTGIAESIKETLGNGLAAIQDLANTSATEAQEKSAQWMLSIGQDDSAETSSDATGSSKGSAVVAEAFKYVAKSDDARGSATERIAYHWASWGPGHCSGILKHAGKEALGGSKHTCCFDCSGLVLHCYKEGADVSLVHQSRSQATAKNGKNIKKGNPSAAEAKDLPLPGDLIFFHKSDGVISHVGICIGDGTGEFIEAPNTGGWVKVSKISSRPNVNKIYRILPEDVVETTGEGGTGTGTPMDITNGDAVTAAELRELLGKIKGGGRIQKYAEQISAAGKKFGVNPLFSIAMSAHETGWWTAHAFTAHNNVGGLRQASHHFSPSGISGTSTDSDHRWEVFKTPGDSFQAKMWLIGKHGYFNEGRTTIIKVIEKYAPASDGNAPKAYTAAVENNMRNFCKKLDIDPDTKRETKSNSNNHQIPE